MRYLGLLLVLLLTGCHSQLKEQEGFLLNTYVKLKVETRDPHVLPAAFATIEDLEAQLAYQQKDSEIAQINAAAGKHAVRVSSSTFQLIQQAKLLAARTDGAFDPTIGAVSTLWQIGTKRARKPAATEIAAALPLVDHRELDLNEANQTVYLKKAGMKLDLSGIAKGYITKKVVAQLKNAGVTSGALDLGGNVYLLGTRPTGELWQAGIKSPFEGQHLLGQIAVENQAVVTSGGYARYVTLKGKKYSHLLDPHTGQPVENDLASVTIIAADATVSDALATAVFVKGSQTGLAYLERYPAVEGVLVTKDHQILLTKKLRGKFQAEDPTKQPRFD